MKQIKLLLLIFIGLCLVVAGLGKIQLPVMGSEDSELSRATYIMGNNMTDKLITSVDTDGKKLAALTFDDGPDPLFTAAVLDILKYYQIKATFFVVGENAEAQSWLLKREMEEGHEVENHTYTHPDLRSKSEIETETEILRTGRLLQKIIGVEANYFRPPRRLYRKETINIAERNGYKMVLWTICVENRKAKTTAETAKRVVNAACPGMIILAHDGRLDRRPTLEALPMIIEGLQEKGYEFITLDELVRYKAERQKGE